MVGCLVVVVFFFFFNKQLVREVTVDDSGH